MTVLGAAGFLKDRLALSMGLIGAKMAADDGCPPLPLRHLPDFQIIFLKVLDLVHQEAAKASKHEDTPNQWVEEGCKAAPSLKYVPIRDSRFTHVQPCEEWSQLCCSNLLSVVLLDLVEPQEGILGAELVLQRVEEDLVLRHLWLSVFQCLVNSD